MFIFSKNTRIISEVSSKPITNAIHILERDRDKVFINTSNPDNVISLVKVDGMEEEQYTLEIDRDTIQLSAGDDLGFVYGLLHISECYLGIKPFWFWMDQKIEVREKIEILDSLFTSIKPVISYRGWFFNDEVLMLQWKFNKDGITGWRMAFETLLRCGGNMTIPGTDKMSRENRELAADMGLWITHHHAEPLGAEMFVRKHPSLSPNFMEHPNLFYQLWEEAVIAQKDYKVIWNLCFRGQGDVPFWNNDTSGRFDTPERQGRLISELIEKQCQIVKKHVKNPVFCTNLYGEIMELYEGGYLELPSDIIKVRADNGFGKMVTRRRDNHSARVTSMPDKRDHGAQGIYYHVSFYDLQAANHITMLPNSISFVDHELSEVIYNGGDSFWVINCSNVRPHTYYLDAVRKKWFGRAITDELHSLEFCADYFDGRVQVATCYQRYPDAMLAYGVNEDEHMGEQYYTENIRIAAHQFLLDRTQNAEALHWIAGNVSLGLQIERVCDLCRNGFASLSEYYQQCELVSESLVGEKKLLFDTTIFLQAKIHYYCAKGVTIFGDAFKSFEQKDYKKAFVLFGKSAEFFDYVNEQMREAEYGAWEDFYLNDCLADVKHTAYMIKKIMGVVREYGDNVRHDKWYREFCYSEEDQSVFLLLVTDNHMTDWELYQIMKKNMNV